MESHMNEPLLGAVSPPWQAVPVPPTGWLPSLLSAAARPLAGAPSPVLAPTLGLTNGIPTVLPLASGLAAGSVTPATTAMPVGATIPSFVGSEVAVGVPVSALL